MMRSETLKLTGTTNQNCADSVTRVLRGVRGVGEIEIALESSEVKVQFDDQITSSQELQNVLVQAGYAISTEKSVHGENGSCCGGCGGS
ncbi:MAG: heavy-metal-associated domain-containing protein [Oxalobacteraceae bacterium]|nr:heavy-metal-associated domain-containing protein [Oxalobacteraceae bacterium]